MLASLKHFATDESGATAIEYGLIAALISVSILVTLVGLSEELVAMYNFIAQVLNDVASTYTASPSPAPAPSP
jgi:pilus assembly protein Flp/PilA